MRRGEAAAVAGAAMLTLWYVTTRHYGRIGWTVDTPAPMLWWWVAIIAGNAGTALLFLAAGVRVRSVVHSGWSAIWRASVPAYMLYLLVVTAETVLRPRLAPDLPAVGLRDLEDLPAVMLAGRSEGWFLFAFAVLPVTARLLRRVPTTPLVGIAAVAAISAGGPGIWSALAWFVAGLRLGLPWFAGRVPLLLLGGVVPATVILDGMLLVSLSDLGSGVQTAVAVMWPIVVTGVLVIGGMTIIRWVPSAAVVAVLAASLPPVPAGPVVTVAFAGDVHFAGRAAALLTDPASAVGPAGRVLAAADLALLNLETAVSSRGTPEPKRYLFRTDARAVPALAAAGVDVVSLANNHSLDYGSDALLDTVDAARAGGLAVVGAGRDDAEAYRAWRVTVQGVRIAVLALSQVDELAERWAAAPLRPGIAMALDVARAEAAVRDAARGSDLVVVLAHWGVEGDSCPSAAQRDLAARLARAGADVVVGAHAHVMQGAGFLDDAFVAYGMGNFLWYSRGLDPPSTSRAGVLTLTVRGGRVAGYAFLPTEMSPSGRSMPLSGPRADVARRAFAALRDCARLITVPLGG